MQISQINASNGINASSGINGSSRRARKAPKKVPQVRKYTTPKKTELIFNKSVLYGQAIKSNIYMERAMVLHEPTDIYDQIDAEMVFGILFKHFLRINSNINLKETYEVECDEFKYVRYSRLAFSKTTNEYLSASLKKYYNFLKHITEKQIKSIPVEHEYQRELLDKMIG